MSLGSSPGAERYVVQLADPAVAAYSGGIGRLQATRPGAGDRLNPTAAPVRRYVAHLESEQAELRQEIAAEIGRAPAVDFTYTYALNGLALRLTADEAAAVAQLPQVTSVVVDVQRELLTDNGPAWVGAPSLWDGSATGVEGTRGEGIVAGVLDTGINPSNPSFAGTVPVEDGGDGYEHTNPLVEGVYLGICDPENTDQYDERFACNDKLIGAWDFSGDGPFDTDGHGSHVASTVAGNQVDAAVNGPSGISDTRTISGVAPHANLIAYDVCDFEGCSMAATTLPSTRPSPTGPTSSTPRSAGGCPRPRGRTRTRSASSPPAPPASSSRRPPATTDRGRSRSARPRTSRGSPRSARQRTTAPTPTRSPALPARTAPGSPTSKGSRSRAATARRPSCTRATTATRGAS